MGSEVTIPERRHSTRSVLSIEPGQIRSECYTNDASDDGQFDCCNTATLVSVLRTNRVSQPATRLRELASHNGTTQLPATRQR